MAMHVAAGLRLPVVMFSLEMSQIELVLRILSSEARIASDRIRTGRLQEDDWPRLSQAVGRISEAPMFIDDTPGITLTEIRSKSRRLKQQHGLSLIVVDYLQLMASPRRVESRVQEVSELSRGLKVLAKELDVPVVALSQLSRKPEERAKDDRRPVLSDLRESGCLTAATRLLRADTGTEVTLGDLAASGARDVPVWSLDDRWRLVRSNLTHAFPSGTKPVFRMTLASGRVVEATGNHKFRTLDAWTPLEELQLGDRLAVPRRLPEPSDTVRMDPDELVLLAHLLGDGCVLPRQPVHYTSADPANLEAVEAAARRRFGITPRRVVQDRWGHTYLPSSHHLTHGLRNPITAWWDDLGLHDCRSHQKFIPDDVHRAAADQIALFLRHLWATDGSLLKSQTTGAMRLHYATTSRRLADDVQRLLLRLRIQSRIGIKAQGADRQAYQVDIDGNDAQQSFLSDVRWDPIAKIEDLGPRPVFDASVEKTHNFIANGIVSHNSIEQDADLVCFIYRDDMYDKDSPAKGEAELIVAKHRNGRTDTVNLAFIGQHSRFASMARGVPRGAPPRPPQPPGGGRPGPYLQAVPPPQDAF